jgi:hypothetical protein
MSRYLLLIFLLLPVLLRAAEERVPLPPAEVTGMDRRGAVWVTRATVYREEHDLLCVEAEAASSLLGTETGAMTDGKANGGAYLADPGALAVECQVVKGGDYLILLRLRKSPKTWRSRTEPINPDTGERRSPEVATVALDGKPVKSDPFAKLGMDWRWYLVGSVTLTPGFHVLTVGELPGFHLDRVGLAPGSVEAGDDGPDEGAEDGGNLALDDAITALEEAAPSPLRVVERAAITTVPITPYAVAKWGTLQIDGDANGCAPAVSVSTDGKTWTPVPAGGDLSAIPVKGDGSDILRARLEWRPAGNAQIPTFTAARVTYTPGMMTPTEIKGPGMIVQLSKSGGIQAIRAGDNWFALPMRRPAFTLGWQPAGGAEQTISADDCAYIGMNRYPDNGTFCYNLTFSHPIGLLIQYRITPASEAGGQWTLACEIKNAGTGTVRWVKCPVLDGTLVDHAILSQSLWSPRGSGVYPGNMGMGWIFASDGARGLYLASQDKNSMTVRFDVPVSNGHCDVAATGLGVIPPQATRTYTWAMAVGSADWHWAADLYRQWAFTWMQRPQWPAWAKRCDGWWTLGSDTEAALLDRKSTTLFEDARWFGLPYMQLWAGLGDGEFCGRMPYLSPRLGTPAAAKADAERLRKMGGHLGYYVQSQEWDAGFAESTFIGFIPKRYYPGDFTVEDRAWSEAHTCNAAKGGGLRAMCAADSAWQAHLARHAGERVTLFGNDAAYFDQMGCVSQTCSAADHAHGPEYAVSGAGFTRMAAEALAAMRKGNPDVTLAQEGMNAATGQHVHFHLPSCLPYADFGSTFLYAFPDSALITGSGNGVFTQYTGTPRSFFRARSVMHRFEAPVYDLYLRDIVLLRARVHDWQYDGRYMDNVGLTVQGALPVGTWCERDYQGAPPKSIYARWFRYESGATKGVLINFQNESRIAGATLTLARKQLPFTPEGPAFLYTDDGNVAPVPVEITPEAVVFPVPDRAVGSFLLPGPAAPDAALRPYAVQSTAAGPDVLTLRAVNCTGAPLAAKWTVKAPAFGLDKSGETTVPARGVARVDLPLALNGIAAMGEATVEWTAAGQRYACSAVLSPPLRNGGMELDANADGSPDSWWNMSNAFAHIIHRFADDVDMRALPARLDTAVKHGGKTSARLNGPLTYAVTLASAFGYKGKEFIWQHSVAQHLYLKPNTAYRATAWAYADKPSASVRFTAADAAQSIPLPPGQWTQLTLDLRTAAEVVAPTITLANDAKDPAATIWVDDIELKEQ